MALSAASDYNHPGFGYDHRLGQDMTDTIRIPTPPRFSDFKFSMIGQPPNLLVRMTSPTDGDTGEEEMVQDPDPPDEDAAVNGLRVRPSLLEVLTGGGDKTTDVTPPPPPPETSVPLNQPTESYPSPDVEMASQSPQSPGRESPVPATPTLGVLRDLHAKVAASLRDLSPVDNSEALALSQSLKAQCDSLLTTARRAHDLAQQAFAAARESLNVSQECLVAAESIQLPVCGVVEAIRKIAPASAERDDPASKWNLSLQAANVQLDLIHQWANRKEAYDAMQKDRAISAEARRETDARPSSSSSHPSPSTDHAPCVERQESAEREWLLAQEKVAERQRVAEEDLRRRREAEDLLERELQDAQREADARAAKLALLKAERQRAEEEEKRTQELEAQLTEERALALGSARQSGRASLGQQQGKQSSGLQESTLQHKFVDKPRQEVRQRQEAEVLGRGEAEPAVEPNTPSSQAPVECAKPRRAETRSPPEAREATTIRPVALHPEQRRESETPRQREVETEADKQPGGIVAERPRVEDQRSQPLKPEVYNIGSAGAGAAEHQQVAASEPTGQQQQAARPEACRLHEAVKSNTLERPIQNQGATESSKVNEVQDQHPPSLVPPTTTVVDDPVQENTNDNRNSSRTRGASFSVGPIPTSPIGNITSRKTLAECYPRPWIFQRKEKERLDASPEQVTTSTQGVRQVAHAAAALVDRSTHQRHFNAPTTTTPFAPKLEDDHAVELQALSGVVVEGSPDNPSKTTTTTTSPPTSSDAFGNVIRLRSKVIPSSPGQQIFRGFPNPLLVKAECKKTGLEIQEGDVPVDVVPSEDSISLPSKPTAVGQSVRDALPATAVSQRSSLLDATLPTKVQLNEGRVASIACANPGPQTSKQHFAAPMRPPPPPILSSATPFTPGVWCPISPHRPLPLSDQQDRHVAGPWLPPPLSPIMTARTRTPEDERRHLWTVSYSPKNTPTRSLSPQQPMQDPARFPSNARPKSDAHHDSDSRMGPDLLSPSAWEGIQDDDMHQRKRPSRRRSQHNRDTPSPSRRSPRSSQVVHSRGEFGRQWVPAGRAARRSRSRETSPRGSRPPFRSSGNPDHFRPRLGARKRSRDEVRSPGPPPRRPRRGGHAQDDLPVIQRNEVSYSAREPPPPTASAFSDLPELTTRLNASRLLEESSSTSGGGARATPLVQRMTGHPSTTTTEPAVVDYREQALSQQRYTPLRPPHDDDDDHSSYNVDHSHRQDLLDRIAVDPPYPDPQVSSSDYHPHPHPHHHHHHPSNSNRRVVNRPRPPRFSGRGRGLQAPGPRSQSLLDRLEAPK